MVAGKTSQTPVELLAPAGEPHALRAALAAGADAVYFGLDRWSARAFAGNFVAEGAVSAVELIHLYGARAYVALNTLLKEQEIGPALAALEAPYLAGLDGLIVADLGLLMRVRAEYPDLPVHASTQLGTHSSAQLAALARFGCSRAVLARELSLVEISALEPHGLELEAFVHGALCYGYSGDCLLSSMIGGRSGNRGRCSQSCRLRYDLQLAAGGSAVPATAGAPLGEDVPAGSASRVMSTSDLAAISVLPQLLAAGVTSFKIEGRMKDAAYVGLTTAVYREALDAALTDPGRYEVRAEWLSRLEQSFSRGFSTAHLTGRHDDVRSGGRGGHRGVLVGRARRVDESRGEVEVRLSKPVASGDLVYLYTPWGQTEPVRLSEGGDASVTLRTAERVAVKDRLFRLAAADAGELARDLIVGRAALRPVIVDMRLDGAEGRPARLAVEEGSTGAQVELRGVVPLAAARTAALTETKARAALGALGGTPYRLGVLRFAVADGLFLPVGELKDLRRRAMAELDELRLKEHRRDGLHPAASAGRRATADLACGRASTLRPGLVLILRPGERPLAAPGVDTLCLDVLSDDALVAVAAAVEQLQATGLPLHVRLPEVLLDADEAWWRAVLALPWQGVYARHLGVVMALRSALLETGRPVPFVLEYPLQGFNRGAAQAAAQLAGRAPAAVVASPEATLEEIAGLATRAAGLEVLAFGRQQVLHTRDRLGKTEGLYEAPASGRHVGLSLTDAKGYLFPATVDGGGTRLYNARITNLAANLDELRDAGVTRYLVVQSDLSAAERSALEVGGLSALAPWASRARSTTGHLFRGVT